MRRIFVEIMPGLSASALAGLTRTAVGIGQGMGLKGGDRLCVLARIALLLPLHRKRLHQPRQRHPFRLPPIQDRLDDIRRQQREPKRGRDIGRVDRLGSRKLVEHIVVRIGPGVHNE